MLTPPALEQRRRPRTSTHEAGRRHADGPLEPGSPESKFLLVGEIFHGYTKESRFAPPGLLRNMVKAGYLGRKTGKGFHDYSEKK
jgi:3-hydroxybutyryl-CoA dehydrogenase